MNITKTIDQKNELRGQIIYAIRNYTDEGYDIMDIPDILKEMAEEYIVEIQKELDDGKL